MNEKTLSERFIAALAQLPQFLPYHSGQSDPEHIVHVLTGVRASAIPDPDMQDHGMIQLQFPGAAPIEVNAALYLDLQLSEAAAHYQHAPSDGSGKIADEANRLHEHLYRKHGL